MDDLARRLRRGNCVSQSVGLPGEQLPRRLVKITAVCAGTTGRHHPTTVFEALARTDRTPPGGSIGTAQRVQRMRPPTDGAGQ